MKNRSNLFLINFLLITSIVAIGSKTKPDLDQIKTLLLDPSELSHLQNMPLSQQETVIKNRLEQKIAKTLLTLGDYQEYLTLNKQIGHLRSVLTEKNNDIANLRKQLIKKMIEIQEEYSGIDMYIEWAIYSDQDIILIHHNELEIGIDRILDQLLGKNPLLKVDVIREQIYDFLYENTSPHVISGDLMGSPHVNSIINAIFTQSMEFRQITENIVLAYQTKGFLFFKYIARLSHRYSIDEHTMLESLAKLNYNEVLNFTAWSKPSLLVNQGKYYATTKNYTKALEYLETARKMDPSLFADPADPKFKEASDIEQKAIEENRVYLNYTYYNVERQDPLYRCVKVFLNPQIKNKAQ